MYLQSHIYKNIPVSFDFITTLNQGVFLFSSCIYFCTAPVLGANKAPANFYREVKTYTSHRFNP